MTMNVQALTWLTTITFSNCQGERGVADLLELYTRAPAMLDGMMEA